MRPIAFYISQNNAAYAADPLLLEPPCTQGPWILQSYQPGSLELTLEREDAGPLEAAQVLYLPRSRLASRVGRPEALAESGRFRLDSLSAGKHRIMVRVAGSLASVAEWDFELGRSEKLVHTLRIPAFKLPQLAASGSILDEQGAPLEDVMLGLEFEDGYREVYWSDREGNFAIHSTHFSPEVTLHPGFSIFGDAYEPAQKRIPFGTTGMLIRRTQVLPERVVSFEVIDASTNQRIPSITSSSIMLHPPRDRSGRILGAVGFTLENGLAEVSSKTRSEVHFFVHARGYRDARGVLGSASEQRVLLEPGFDVLLTVRDKSSQEAIQGARFLDAASRDWASSDPKGRVRLQRDEWPSTSFSVRCPGYEETQWDSLNYRAPQDAVLYLNRIE